MEVEKALDVASCTINDLFSCEDKYIENTSIKGILSIPEYQRPYVWGPNQLDKLIKDIREYQNDANINKSLYYLGSIILHKKNDNLNVIDGQQRITTILLWYSLQNTDYDLPIHYSSPSSIDRIKKNIKYLRCKEEELPRIDLNQLNVTLVVTSKEDDAYTFFETQNTGGVRLSGVDIIKSHHLRAISDTRLLNQYAQSWECLNNLNYIVDLMAKARCWNFLNWREYPKFRNVKAIKESVVNEFTENTIKENRDITYRQVHIVELNEEHQICLIERSKSVRQPLYDGINTIGYFQDMVCTYQSLFTIQNDSKVPEAFYKFRDKLINGLNGSVFLKELFELCTLVYVNKFGFSSLFEFSLWAFRYCYSTRVSNERTVREDTIFKFIREEKLIDKIVNAYTHDEVLEHLKRFNYTFNDNNIDTKNVKGRFIKSLTDYFSPKFANEDYIKNNYDQQLKTSIHDKLKKI